MLGSRAVPLMLEAGHEVTAIGRTPEKRALLERQGARAVDVDLFDPGSVRRAVRGAEVICNLATAVPPTEVRTVLPWSWARDGPHPASRLARQTWSTPRSPTIRASASCRVVRAHLRRWRRRMARRVFEGNRPATIAPPSRPKRAPSASGAGRVGVVLGLGCCTARVITPPRPDRGCPSRMVRAVRATGGVLFVGRARGRRAGGRRRARRARRLQRGRGRTNAPAGAGERDRATAGRAAAQATAAVATPPGGVIGKTIARSLRVSNRKLRSASGWMPRHRTALDGFGRSYAGEERRGEGWRD